MLHHSYLACPSLVCFDNAGDPPAAAAAAAAAVGGDPPAAGAGDPPKNFTQEEVNKFLAEDRRKHQERLQRLEGQLAEISESKNLSEQERAKLEETLEDVRKQFRTKEQQLAHERKQLEEQFTGRIKDLEGKAQVWETRYRESTITRALQDAAVSHDSFQPSQVVTILRPMTKMVEIPDQAGKSTGQFKPMIDFPDKDPNTGEEILTQRTPEDAVKRMKELPDLYGNLFKSGVVSGIGSGSGTGGLTPGQGGRLDVTKLTTEQYMKIRKENPELLGLKRRR
jgi:hypothetical protein